MSQPAKRRSLVPLTSAEFALAIATSFLLGWWTGPTAALSMHWVNRPTTQGLAMFPEPSGSWMLGAGAVLVAALARGRFSRS